MLWGLYLGRCVKLSVNENVANWLIKGKKRKKIIQFWSVADRGRYFLEILRRLYGIQEYSKMLCQDLLFGRIFFYVIHLE